MNALRNWLASALGKPPTTSIAPVSFNVTADPGVEYVVFDVQKRPDGLIEVFSRRRGSSGTSYARRLVDCQNWKFMYHNRPAIAFLSSQLMTRSGQINSEFRRTSVPQSVDFF